MPTSGRHWDGNKKATSGSQWLNEDVEIKNRLKAASFILNHQALQNLASSLKYFIRS